VPRLKQNSDVIDKAASRLSQLKSISPNLDLGKGMTVQAFSDAITTARDRMSAYNTTLSHLEADRTAMQEAEKAVSEMSEKMLIGVAFEYGKDSSEYSMAGGVRKSQRKRPARKAIDKSADAAA
jgi:hypothetical protein